MSKTNKAIPLHLLSKSFSMSSLSHSVSNRAFQSDKDADFMVYNNENQTAGDILRSRVPVTVYKTPRSIYRLAPRDVPSPFQEEPHTSQLTRSQEERKEKMLRHLKKSSEAHLVVATLIATVSFAAGMTVPGGFNQNPGVAQGMALFTKQTAFQTFSVSNALALALSSTAILIHFAIVMLEEPKLVEFDHFVSQVATVVSLVAMMVAFMAGTYATMQQSTSLVIKALAFPAFFMFIFVYFVMVNAINVLMRFIIWMRETDNVFTL